MNVLRKAGLLVLAAGLAAGAAANPVRTDNVTASLIARDTGMAPGATHWVALRLAIRPGWHTYWRNPGDSGEPTTIAWTLPEGVRAGPIAWPAPEAIPFGGFVNYGYEGDALHPVALDIDPNVAPGTELRLQADASWLVCEEICIPESARLTLTVPVTNAPGTGAGATAIDAALARVPRERLTASATVTDGVLRLALPPAPRLAAARWFPHEWGAVEPAAEQRLTVGEAGPVLSMPLGPAPPAGTFEGALVAEDVSGATHAFLLTAQWAGAAPAAAAPPAPLGLPTALAFAFLGGLILNLMPCVFPVLSMKALQLVSGAGEPAAVRRAHGLAYGAGVLVFFALLGGVLLALRASGQAVGWGFQLQSPWLVAALSLLMFAIGLLLLDAFAVGGRWTAWGGALTQRGGVGGSFFTGALAAVVATPCTAPFMGAALGFALTQNAAVALGVLLALGAGLAAPFVALSWVPGLARRLPAPGAWMATLKQFLAFPMFGAAVWLAWVLAVQSGADGVLRLLAAALLLGFAAWAARAVARRRVGRAAALAALAAAVVLLAGVRPLAPAAASAESFSVARLEALRADGRTVFVNQTAAWCLTCLVNETNVLSSARVQAALAAGDVAYLEGDWTRRDEAVTRYLARYGRSGVPLYVVYHGERAGRVLPPLLTEALVLEALAPPDD